MHSSTDSAAGQALRSHLSTSFARSKAAVDRTASNQEKRGLACYTARKYVNEWNVMPTVQSSDFPVNCRTVCSSVGERRHARRSPQKLYDRGTRLSRAFSRVAAPASTVQIGTLGAT
jgi:hypothetical protein